MRIIKNIILTSMLCFSVFFYATSHASLLKVIFDAIADPGSTRIIIRSNSGFNDVLPRIKFNNMPDSALVSRQSIVSIATDYNFSPSLSDKNINGHALNEALAYFEPEKITKKRASLIINNFMLKPFERFIKDTFGEAGIEYVDALQNSTVQMRKTSSIKRRGMVRDEVVDSMSSACNKIEIKQSIKDELRGFTNLVKLDIRKVRDGYIILTENMIRKELDYSVKRISRKLASRLPDKYKNISQSFIDKVTIDDKKVTVNVASACGLNLTTEIRLVPQSIKAVTNKEGIGIFSPYLNIALTR